jgi:uncharacterized protein (TIGR02145 family)
MKKLLISFFALTLSFCGFTQTQSFCNDSVPGWGKSLGTITFHTDRVWTISNDTIAQIWSDAVTATACQKESFDGGYRDSTTGHHWGEHNYSADCRSNPNFPGDLFSWCAVVRFADQLCPYPWRVPTLRDFRDLDAAMGGTRDNRTDLDFVNENYVARWGAVFGGSSLPTGSLHRQGSWVRYWAINQENVIRGFSLLVVATGFINPFMSEHKHNGFSLRCVQNN